MRSACDGDARQLEAGATGAAQDEKTNRIEWTVDRPGSCVRAQERRLRRAACGVRLETWDQSSRAQDQC